MTSEVLIINKDTIAMAADSAVTIDEKKTYHGVNKLFCLSQEPPMGIMIFGSPNFGKIYMEALIKDFSRKYNFKELGDVESIKDSFNQYLEDETKDENFIDLFSRLDLFKEKFLKLSENWSDNEWNDFSKLIVKKDLFSFLNEKDKEKLNKRLERIISNFNNEYLAVDLLKTYFYEDLINSSTGVVIAGFNKKDFFPSYVSFNMITKYDGKIIFQVNSSRNSFMGTLIIPFAQSDVINTFIGGIDEQLELSIMNYFLNFINRYLDELKEEMKINDKINGTSLNNVFKVLEKKRDFNELRANEFLIYLTNFKGRITNSLLKYIDFLPEDELSTLAKSLIHITSLKRKISPDLESVGGDIDVAIISKGDGFVWK